MLLLLFRSKRLTVTEASEQMTKRVNELQRRIDAEVAACSALTARLAAAASTLESSRKKIKIQENLPMPTITSTAANEQL